jgi:hypothetical protein
MNLDYDELYSEDVLQWKLLSVKRNTSLEIFIYFGVLILSLVPYGALIAF